MTYQNERGGLQKYEEDGSAVVSGGGYDGSTSTTRPANTTLYTAGDVVGDGTNAAIEITGLGPNNGRVAIVDVLMRVHVSSVPSGMTTHKLHLYSAAPAVLADNDPWVLADADRATYQDYITLDQAVDVGGTILARLNVDRGTKFVKLSATGSLFIHRATDGGYTPTSAAVSVIKMMTVN
jgi:hypothetical protein